ncbi:MAG: metallophosphoesterase family protein [Gammaproteobacteria bacterium]
MPVVGLISDTHGLLRPDALAALDGCDLLIHGGDIGPAEILDALRERAPLTVVRGNNDTAAWARALPQRAIVDVDGVRICAVHDLKTLDIDLRAESVDVVVSGHSHRPSSTRRDGVLYVNPGSAGPRRFSLPISVARLDIHDGQVTPRIIQLPTPLPGPAPKR